MSLFTTIVFDTGDHITAIKYEYNTSVKMYGYRV